MPIDHLRPDFVKGKYDCINKQGYNPECYENSLEYSEGYAEALAVFDAKSYSQSSSILQLFPKEIQDHYHHVYHMTSHVIKEVPEFL